MVKDYPRIVIRIYPRISYILEFWQKNRKFLIKNSNQFEF